MYPKFLFHKDLAPEGRLIKDETFEPTEPGWVDTPQKFDPKYVEPAKVSAAPGTVPADKPDYVPVAYPSYRFNQAGESRVVASAEEDAELDADEWRHSPAAFAVKAAPATPPTKPMSAADKKAAIYNASAKDLIAQVGVTESIEELQIVKGFEEGNPTVARKTVLAAIDAQLAKLGYQVPA